MGSDWLSKRYRESRPVIDEAAASVGRDPSAIIDVFNFSGRITSGPLDATRGEDGRWIGGSVQQWIDELTSAVLEQGAGGFIYRNTDDTPAPVALARYAQESCPRSARQSRTLDPVAVTAPCDGLRPAAPVASPPTFGHGDRGLAAPRRSPH